MTDYQVTWSSGALQAMFQATLIKQAMFQATLIKQVILIKAISRTTAKFSA
jgi:hypothetical protein